MRKTFIEKLPHKYGIGANKNKLIINWKISIGYIVNFKYNDIQGEIEIIDYYKKNKHPYLKIKYNNNIFNISTGDFKECRLGKVLGTHTNTFKIEIGQTFKDNKRDITIINRKYEIKERINKKGKKSIENKKLYKYRCNKCGFECGEHYRNGEYKEEHWISESSLLEGDGCSCCCPSPKVTVPKINSIVANEETQWMIPYFQSGYDEAKKYTYNSNQKIYPICPDCGRIKDKSITINKIYNYHSIGCICSDKISYPEKFVFNIFKQLDIDFIYQLTSKNLKWCNKYHYDFYFKINNEDYIIETNGMGHYEEGFSRCGGRTLKEEIENDRLKKELALKNGIKEENYIVIDCRESEMNWIKEHMLQSDLNDIFDLSKIDWLECHKYACSSLVKKACDLWVSDIHSTKEISKIMKLNKSTIIKYLKQGKELGWCNYDPKKVIISNGKRLSKNNERKIICLNNNKIFNSIKEILKYYNLKSNHITDCCQGKQKSCGKDLKTGEKLCWMYYDKYLKLIKNK